MSEGRPKVRLFIDSDLAAGAGVGLSPEHARYLGQVMRLGPGDEIGVFNGRDGEWRARIDSLARGRGALEVSARLRPQDSGPDLWLVFAPLKRARIGFIAEKATELGVAALRPVYTRFTTARRVNTGRLRAHAIEAAEQCGRLGVPEVHEPEPLTALIARWPPGRRLMFCDESGRGAPARQALSGESGGPWAVLVGPEGGFAAEERAALAGLPFATAVSLGPRVLRADTAVVAALGLWQHTLGDWGTPPASAPDA